MELDERRLRRRIEEIMMEFVAVRSDTNSAHERGVESFFQKWFSEVPYFKENPDLCGLYPIPDDHLNRHVPWCLRKGTGNDTIIYIHHSDCVETLDYGMLEEVCLNPPALLEAFKANKKILPGYIADELETGEWLVGRGVADMKGGGAIEMALVEEYCENKNFKGNVVIVSVPDEENLSAGMLGACFLLKELKEKHGLNYILMVDTESHERDTPDAPAIYDGSVGKIMPVVYVRGKLAHVGQVYSGLNPINLLSEIIRRTELNVQFIEKSGNTVTPPGTWLYCKDRKEVYDVSLPLAATGYMSILPLDKTAKELMDIIKKTCVDSFEHILQEMNESYRAYQLACGTKPVELPFKTNVKFFAELYEEAVRDGGDAFLQDYKETYATVQKGIIAKETSMIDGVNALIAVALRHVKDPFPMVIVALSPPYYPSVNNAKLDGKAVENARKAIDDVMDFAKTQFGQNYVMKNYYTGISDLSYAMFSADEENISYIKNNMLLWGEVYSIPLDIIKELSMPVVNIGPWAKDIHKYTERVLSDDLYRVTPQLIHKITCDLLGN